MANLVFSFSYATINFNFARKINAINISGMDMRIIPLQQRTEAFVRLGRYFAIAAGGNIPDGRTDHAKLLQNLIESKSVASLHNPWFVTDNIDYSLQTWADALTEKNLQRWLARYADGLKSIKEPRTVAVVMAGNIPLVGFHDFLSVLVSGNRFLGKLSADDAYLLPAAARLLTAIEPLFAPFISFTTDKLTSFDAVIATGSNNTSRYFEYYFGRYPHIIRRNRNGIAVLTGNESTAELESLSHDIFHYFGLGCRNVSMIYVPRNYNFTSLAEACRQQYGHLDMHHKYMNNYTYQRAIFMMNNIAFIDNGFFLITENVSFISPVSVIHYQTYDSIESLHKQIESEDDNIQCIVSNPSDFKRNVPFGKSQQPELRDYADGIDTINFLTGMGKQNSDYEQNAVK